MHSVRCQKCPVRKTACTHTSMTTARYSTGIFLACLGDTHARELVCCQRCQASMYGGVEITPFVCVERMVQRLTTKAIQSASLALEGVHNIKSCDGLPACVLSVGDGVPDHVLKEHLEHAPCLLIYEPRDTLDTSTASQTPDGGLCNACRAEAIGVSRGYHNQDDSLRVCITNIVQEGRSLKAAARATISRCRLNDTWPKLRTISSHGALPARLALKATYNGFPGTKKALLTLDVVAEHLPVALGTSLAKALSSLAAARHACRIWSGSCERVYLVWLARQVAATI